MPVTLGQIGSFRVGKTAGKLSPLELILANIPEESHCVICGRKIPYYKTYPSKDRFLLCRDCIGSSGWESVQKAHQEIFGD